MPPFWTRCSGILPTRFDSAWRRISTEPMRYGLSARAARRSIWTGRSERLDIVTFGDSAGIVNLEFMRPIDGIEQYGRQTQFWFRFREGWRIASAHVSLVPTDTTYLNATASEIGLRIAAENRTPVNEDLKRIATIAGFLMQFPLSQDVEAAPVFRP